VNHFHDRFSLVPGIIGALGVGGLCGRNGNFSFGEMKKVYRMIH
jgi:hypothetical protein